MISMIFSWFFRIVGQGLLWTFILSLRFDGYTLFDHIRDRFVTDEVMSLLEETAEGLWSEWGGQETLKAQSELSLEKYRAYKSQD